MTNFLLNQSIQENFEHDCWDFIKSVDDYNYGDMKTIAITVMAMLALIGDCCTLKLVWPTLEGGGDAADE